VLLALKLRRCAGRRPYPPHVTRSQARDRRFQVSFRYDVNSAWALCLTRSWRRGQLPQNRSGSKVEQSTPLPAHEVALADVLEA